MANGAHVNVDGGGAVSTAKRAVATAKDRQLTFLAAAFAYYAVSSLIPLFVVSAAVLSYFGAVDVLFRYLQGMPEGFQSMLVESLKKNRSIAGGAAFLVALWSGLKVFRGLDVAFSKVYDAESDLSLTEQLRDGLIVLGLVFLGFVVLATIAAAVSVLRLPIPAPVLVGNVVALVALTLVFLPVYYVLPPIEVDLREVAPGAFVGALGVVLLQVALYYYLSYAGGSAYGALGGVLLFVTFLYFAGIVILFGAVVNVALDRPTPLGRNRPPR